MHTETHIRGNTRQQRYKNPLTELIRIMGLHPQGRRKLDVYRRYMRDKADELILNDPSFRDAIHEYWFSNNFTTAMKHMEPDFDLDEEEAPSPGPIVNGSPKGKPTKTPAQIAKEKADQERRKREEIKRLEDALDRDASQRVNVKLLELLMPNGTKVFDSKGTDIERHAKTIGNEMGINLRKAFWTLGKHLGKKTPREAGMTQAGVEALIRKQTEEIIKAVR